MNRFAEVMVPLGLRIDWRRASCPTSRSPSSEKATTDGVVLDPSAFGTTEGSPPSQTAMTELVVPRSMPTAFAMGISSVATWDRAAGCPAYGAGHTAPFGSVARYAARFPDPAGPARAAVPVREDGVAARRAGESRCRAA